MSATISFNYTKRQELGTSPTCELREAGLVPAVIYGKGQDNVHISLSSRDIEKNIKALYDNSVIELQTDGGDSYKVIAKFHEVHPISSKVIHVDFVFFNDIESKFYVPLVYTNRELSAAIKFGAVLNIVKRKLLVKCKPQYLPQRIEVDVKDVKTGSSITVSDIKIPENVTLVVQDKKAVIATIIGKKVKKEAATSEAK